MGKKYEVKDINKNGKIDSWEQAKYDAINQAPANIGKLLQSQPGSMGLMNPNQAGSKIQSMSGMDVSTNAQILNQAYDPRSAVNYMGMAKKGRIEKTN